MDDRDLEQMMNELCEADNSEIAVQIIYDMVTSPQAVDNVLVQYDIIDEISWYYPSCEHNEVWNQIFEYSDRWTEAWIKCFFDYNGIKVYAGNNKELETISKFYL